jgi:hypothetical protein
VRHKSDSGIALITVLLILLLVSGVIVGMSWMVLTDQRLSGNNLNRDIAFYGAEAGMEKLTADLGNQFATEGAITGGDVTTLESTPPSSSQLPGISFTNASNSSTYLIECGQPLVNCTTPTSTTATILAPSPYAGMNAIISPFTLMVTASQLGGGEVKLRRDIQLVAIPVFQFGIYSDTDLSFFNGPSFNFGGRVHTNGNLWLAPNSGPLYLADKVTVVGQVLRTNLENGWPLGSTISAGGDYSGTATIALTPNPSTLPSGPSYSNTQWRPLGLGESSVTGSSVYGNVSTTTNSPTWANAESAYNGMLINGVAPLTLTSTALGGLTQPITLIQRAVPGEAAANPALYSQRYYSQGSVRILLDDYPAGTAPGGTGASSNTACHSSDMMSLDGIDTSTDPYDLSRLASATAPSWWGALTYYPLPTAKTSGSTPTYSSGSNGYWETNGSPIITGCLKIEYQDKASTPAWHDITTTILKLGYMGKNINPTTGSVGPALHVLPATGTVIAAQGPIANGAVTPVPCTEPYATTAVIRIARIRDNPSGSTANGCGTPATSSGQDFWPLALFDSREGTSRPGVTTATNSDGNPEIPSGGVMYYIELDAKNLATWLRTNQSALSPVINNNTGFAVYFSDRRGEQLDTSVSPNKKTGSFGYNDIVNPASVSSGCPDGTINGGEDFEGDGVLRTYGGTAETLPYSSYQISGAISSGRLNAFAANPNCSSPTVWPGIVYNHTQEARENSPAFFRRALKIVDGDTLNLGTSCFSGGTPACGLTITAENPVYIQGDYNVPGLNMTSTSSVATSIAGDAVTLLSDNWNDVNSFISPYDSGSRDAVETMYRVALIGGKGIPFSNIGSTEDFGTDGGLHNFLRFLENWGSVNCDYGGSMVSFYYYRQAVGTYKNNGQVYSPPNRIYNYDTNFSLGTQYLPPLTPKLHAINTIGFTQEINPTQ